MGKGGFTSGNAFGILFVLGASLAFSINDLVFKVLSDAYPLHQMIFVRSVVALALCAAIIVPLAGGVSAIKTRRPSLHLLRGVFVVTSNIALYTGIAVLPLADTIAVFFSAPLMITCLSAFVLKEAVGVWRWGAVIVGLIGVLCVAKPGFSDAGWYTLLPIFAAFTYALVQIMTRWLGVTERPVTLFFYNQVVFVVFSAAFGLTFGAGQFANPAEPAVDFIFRAWSVPSHWDLGLLIFLGVLSAGGGYLMTLAYASCPANLIAPFEYSALVLAVLWGAVIFSEFPDGLSTLGIMLIIASGLGVALREARLGKIAGVKQFSARR